MALETETARRRRQLKEMSRRFDHPTPEERARDEHAAEEAARLVPVKKTEPTRPSARNSNAD